METEGKLYRSSLDLGCGPWLESLLGQRVTQLYTAPCPTTALGDLSLIIQDSSQIS